MYDDADVPDDRDDGTSIGDEAVMPRGRKTSGGGTLKVSYM